MRIADEIEEACELTYAEMPQAVAAHFRDFANEVLQTARELADVSNMLVEEEEILNELDVEKATLEWLKERESKWTARSAS